MTNREMQHLAYSWGSDSKTTLDWEAVRPPTEGEEPLTEAEEPSVLKRWGSRNEEPGGVWEAALSPSGVDESEVPQAPPECRGSFEKEVNPQSVSTRKQHGGGLEAN